MKTLRMTVLVSGGGTNLQAIIDSIADGTITNAEIVGVISNNPGVFALERAAKAGIPAFVISPKAFSAREEFNAALKAKIDELGTDLVVLAGCLVTIPEALIDAYENKIVNIHPALIPSFCGKGYYGLKVHEAALARGVKLSGATVHFVNKDLDAGPIILQKAVEVLPGDTPKVLQQRIMEQAEWKIMPEAINLIANGKVSVVDGKAVISE
ncbi:MAG: phosphoribosylglycinamide formyltransferase [Lachnospiraceae bacterium]|jgi:phosphoribosylglycinamide formyltransferase-1|nr:phosphoribosylglycinamide formyltransferase [Lachnospiraceae bacterium]MEE3437716.1 phosphoribosylglycinamide formyltransferase [Lachnospiraceae bacterium]